MPSSSSDRQARVDSVRAAPPWWPAVLVFSVSLFVNLLTCARSVTLVDSGELIVACAGLGVAHPPGFPFYTMVGFLFSLLPVGSVAFRLAVMSSVFAALTAAVLAMIVGEVAVATTPVSRRDPGVGSLTAATAAIVAGLAFAFSASFWGYATVAEVYTLTLALLAGSIWSMLRWRRHGADQPLPWVTGLALGLGLASHHVTVILALPGMLAFVLATAGRRGLAPRRLAPAVAGAAVGLLSYLYLPLAAARKPVLSWGNPVDLERLWWHVSARQYHSSLFAGDPGVAEKNLVEMVRLLAGELTFVGLLAIAAGVFWLWRRDRAVLLLVALVSLFGASYAVAYDIAEDTEAYLLSTLMVAAVVLGSAVVWFMQTGRRRRWLTVATAALSLTLPVGNAVRHWRTCDRSDDMVARHFVEDVLAGIGDGGVVLTAEWQLYAPWLYLHHIEKLRPDVAMVDVNLCRRSWYVGEYLPSAHPRLAAAVEPEVRGFLTVLDDWEHGRPHDPAELTHRFNTMLDAMLRAPLPVHDAHLTLPMDHDIAHGLTLTPHGLTMKVRTGAPGALPPQPALHLTPFLADPRRLTPVAHTKVRSHYVRMFELRARYLTLIGDTGGAEESLELARALRRQ